MTSSSITEIKSIIRGLLISSPETMNVSKLRHDFKSQEGHDIPFYEFGFHDITSFLRSIPDVCRISCPVNGPYAIVSLVESDKSAHVNSLVLRQRTTTKGRRRHTSFPVHGRFSQFSHKPLPRSHPKPPVYKPFSYQPTQNQYYQNYAPYFANWERVTNHFTQFAYSPTTPVYNGDTVDEVEWSPDCEEGNSNLEIIENPKMTEDELTELQNIVDNHLNQILSPSEGIPLKDVQEYLLSMNIRNSPDFDLNLKDVLRQLPHIKIEGNLVYLNNPSTCSSIEQNHEEITNITESESTADEVNGGLEDDNSNIGEKRVLPALNSFIPTGASEKVQRLERNLYSLMKDHVRGILGSELKEKYKMKFAAPLNLQTLGYETIWDLAYKMPHIFTYQALENGDFKLFPSEQLPEQNFEDSNDFVVERNVLWLMQGYPNGLHAKDFEKTYKDTFLGDIDLMQFNCSTIEELFDYLEQQKIVKIQVAESDTWLLPSQKSPEVKLKEEPLPTDILRNEIDIKTLKEKFPIDVVGPDVHVEQVELPSWIARSSIIEIFVQEVNNPHNFWITLCGVPYSRALDSLMDDLQAFYCTKSHSYKMPAEFIREGQDCVTQYVEEWHRARITNVIDAKDVEVVFYDYGTRRIVPKANIHYLHTAHSALPAQAVRAVLANIVPVEGNWTQDASRRFLSLIANKALIGIVIAVDRITNTISLFLCDTSSDDDIYIHEALVTEGYAVETDLDTNARRPQNNEKTEEKSENELNMLLPEEGEGMLTNVNSTEEVCILDKDPKVSNSTSINQEDSTIYSDDVHEMHTTNSSGRSSQMSLPYKFIKDTNHPVSTTSFCGTASTSQCASALSKTFSNSAGHTRQIAPPPGFSHGPKYETESSNHDKTESHAFSITSRNDVQEEESTIEMSKNHSHQIVDDMKERENKEKPVTFGNISQGQPVKGVSSGVNANFSQDPKASYLQSNYAYPNWIPVTQTYSTFPVFPSSSFPSVNTLAPISLTPFGMPNPLDFCNMWYYEQFRHQAAFLQGMLAHQQMAASAFPPLPPGMYVPQNYSTLSTPSTYSSQNQINISEVQTPLTSPNLNVEAKETVSSYQADIINAATQTDLLSSRKSRDEALRKRPSEISLPANTSGCAAADASAQTNEGYASLYEHRSSSETLQSSIALQTNEDNSDVAIEETSLEEVIDVNDSNIGYSSLPKNEGQNLELSGNNFKEITSSPELDVNLNKTLSALNKPTAMRVSSASNSSINFHDTQGSIKKENETNTSEQIFPNNCDLQISHVIRSSVDEHNFEIQSHDALRDEKPSSSQNAVQSQIVSDTISEENDTVLLNSRNVPDHQCFEGDGVRTIGDNGERNSNNISVLENDQIDIAEEEEEEEEEAQEVYTGLNYKQEEDLNEDVYHEHEMIEKAQQENAMKVLFEQSKNTLIQVPKDLSRTEAIQDTILTGESLDLNKEEEAATILPNRKLEFSSCLQSSLSNVCTYESDKKEVCKEIKKINDTKDWVEKFEIVTDQLLEQERQFSAPQLPSRCAKLSPISSDTYFETASQKQSSTSETLCTEFRALSVSNEAKDHSYSRVLADKHEAFQEQLHVNSQVPNTQNHIPLRTEVCKTQANPLKKIRPVLGAKLSNEVSASFTYGPSQPAMIQKMTSTSGTLSCDQGAEAVSCDALSQPVSWKTTWNTEELNRSSTQRQIGHESTKNLTISSAFKVSSKHATPLRHKESHSSMKQGTNFQFVKKIRLCDKMVHQINLDGRPYVLTDEIVSYFTPFNGRHVILKILEARKVEINFLELSRRRRPEFFECLDKSDIQCISRGPTGNVIGSVHIVPLRSVPYMLRALNRDDAVLAEDVKKEMENFDPCDPHWC